MQKIELINALPKVFAGQNNISSEVWLKPLVFEKGKKYLISAESGSGKSSLCAYIFGYRTDFLGEILFDGTTIRNLSIDTWCNIRKTAIAYLPQELRLFPELSALENVQLKNRLTDYKSEKEIISLFEQLGIPEKVNQPVAKLSIGQQQRVAIIRTLCQPCDFFLLDEPVSHLDCGNNTIVADLIANQAKETGAGIIATSVGNNLNMNTEEVLKL